MRKSYNIASLTTQWALSDGENFIKVTDFFLCEKSNCTTQKSKYFPRSLNEVQVKEK